ncbi:MAG TPA: helix-turn-helix domain-containing protein [Steroidobacteraceae bacterium]|jgi:AraC family transcriptional regulator|nr:helix-turn-helix domain-containing protein [Steroidobacteraceae bacterium]
MRQYEILSVVQSLVRRPSSLHALANRAGWSAFHLHRALHMLLGETPKQYSLRLRLERAAHELLTSCRHVKSIAGEAGFRSHEVFTRAFCRQFRISPGQYRAQLVAAARRGAWKRHAAIISLAGPCIRLFHLPLHPSQRLPAMSVTVTRKDCPEQPVLLIRRRIARGELQKTFAECFGMLFGHGQRSGLPIAGWPLARYVAMGPGLWTIEAAMPLASPAPASGEMQPGSLPAGPAAFAVHVGAYERLPDTHAAIERWIEAQGYQIGGAPWESYVTDPAQHPDPAQWRTEVYWPLAASE